MGGDDMSLWPNLLRQLAEAIGKDLTLKLAAAVGGARQVWIPLEYKEEHLWSGIIPKEKWPAVASVCGGRRVDLPRGAFIGVRKPRIIELLSQGVSPRDIAMRLGISQRYVEITRAMCWPERERGRRARCA